MMVGWLTMIPYVSGGIGLVSWGMISDRMNERRWNLLGACAVSTIGLTIAGADASGTWWSMVGLSVATFGFYGSKGPFWSMPPMFLTGTAAAASIAWINSIGNLGGFFGPWYVRRLVQGLDRQLCRRALRPRLSLCVISAVVCALFLRYPRPGETAGAGDAGGRAGVCLMNPPPRWACCKTCRLRILWDLGGGGEGRGMGGGAAGRGCGSLDRLDGLAKWYRFEKLVGHLRDETTPGRPGYPALVLFKAIVLQSLYGLSERELEEALDDRLSFRRFVGLSLEEAVPDHTVINRFRNRLVGEGLLEKLFAELDRQLEKAGVILKRGTMLDATLIRAASAPPGDRRPTGDGPGCAPGPGGVDLRLQGSCRGR